MKLRQKLAVVLASAMVVTAVPVVTMAASTNSLSRETLKVKEDYEFVGISTANAVKIKFTDASENAKEVFYLDLENAEWNEDTLQAALDAGQGITGEKGKLTFTSNGAQITYERQNDTTMKVTVTGVTTDKIVQLPILAKAKNGEAKVSVVSQGGSTTVSKGTFVFATTADKKMSVTAKSDKTFYTKGELAEITIEEAYAGALKDGGEFTIELNDSDFKFDEGTKYTIEGKYGFSSKGKIEVEVKADTKDAGKLTVTLPKVDGDTRGTWTISGLKVKSTVKKPSTGDFLVDIKGDDLVAEKTDLKLATISEYGVYVKMNDDKAEDVKAGRIEEVEFKIGETVEDSMITGREFEIKLDNGYWDYKALVQKAFEKGKLTKVTLKTEDVKKDDKTVKVIVAGQDDDDWKEQALHIDTKWLAEQIVDNKGDWSMDTVEAEFDEDDDKAVVETIIFTIGKDNDGNATQANDDCDEIEFKTNICVSVEAKEKEKVTLTVSGRALEKEVSTTAINIINPFNVKSEQAVLKVGKQGQVSGIISLTETDKDMFQKGDIKFAIKDKDENVEIYLTDCTVETSGGIKGTKSKVNEGKKGNVVVTLNRTSKEASTITLKDMKFTTDRTVPEGTYDLEISGSGIDQDGNKLTIEQFVKISTANTEELTTSGLARGIAKFAIGESKYTLNDKEVEMDAPSYIQDPGYTMVPVRYVANAFGVADSDILFGKGTVTLFAGERTISLTTGSNIAVVNGNSVAMSTKVVNKDGRTYVPAGQIASLLGLTSTWDSATKTATFENK
ncbi:stalk domain-containing protein [Cellulosilyticum ruminicola]|uniref:stalk domain-containing protein n=1 Tax=Cellulosilyticum ruminicola TaxID=425254 RepID=UPI0006CF7C7D|nr:stalk domain-containing protein [Cellulosilyticum ruminicola]